MAGPWDTVVPEAAEMGSLEGQIKEPDFTWKQGRTSRKVDLRLAGESNFFSE